MTDLLNLTVMGDPVPKGRPRTGGGRIYTPHRTAIAEQALREAALRTYTRTGATTAYDGPVGIELTFYCATRRHVDSDNLQKLVMDAQQRGRHRFGGVILDDAQVETWSGRLVRGQEGQEPRTEIRVYALPRHEPVPRTKAAPRRTTRDPRTITVRGSRGAQVRLGRDALPS